MTAAAIGGVRRDARGALARWGTCLALLAAFAAFAPNFASPANVLRQASFLAILSVGFTLALVVADDVLVLRRGRRVAGLAASGLDSRRLSGLILTGGEEDAA